MSEAGRWHCGTGENRRAKAGKEINPSGGAVAVKAAGKAGLLWRDEPDEQIVRGDSYTQQGGTEQVADSEKAAEDQE